MGNGIMRDAAGNTPAVARSDMMRDIADRQVEPSGNEVPGLLVGMAMPRQDRALFELDLGKQGLLAIHQRFHFNFIERVFIPVEAAYVEHEELPEIKVCLRMVC